MDFVGRVVRGSGDRAPVNLNDKKKIVIRNKKGGVGLLGLIFIPTPLFLSN